MIVTLTPGGKLFTPPKPVTPTKKGFAKITLVPDELLSPELIGLVLITPLSIYDLSVLDSNEAKKPNCCIAMLCAMFSDFISNLN